ncbi:MAG: DnaD domain protein [Oscillospiraceae bacterium]|nr:DnaD domain protein [Oscillospiraceae bacterium]
MSKSEYILPIPETVAMTQTAADALISSGRGDAALLYIYILRNKGYFSEDAAREKLGQDFPLAGAAAELESLGLIAAHSVDVRGEEPEKKRTRGGKGTVEREDAPPQYTAEDVKRGADSDPAFASLISEVQQRLGKMLTGADLMILFGIYDYLGLPAEVILILLSYCIEEQERRLGEGRKPTMRMVEKEAYFWARSDIFTLDAAEEYIKRKNERRKNSYEIRNLLGIKNRQLSTTEEKYIMSWLEMGFSSQAIAMAYDRTVLNKKELVWPYMNRIMESWHKKGLHSVSEIEAGDRRTSPARAQASGAPTGEEYERMRRFVNKLGGGDDGP